MTPVVSAAPIPTKLENNHKGMPMAKDKKQEIREGHPDAAHYALQPTSVQLRPEMGDVPKGRFLEEVLKGNASGDAQDAHPEENQPPYGVTKEGQPDTSGRSQGRK